MDNGHKDWQHWNVALWLSNDEGLYRFCIDALDTYRTTYHAAMQVYSVLEGESTPDGAEYTYETVYAALEDLRG